MMKITMVLAMTRNNKNSRKFRKLSSLAIAKGDLVGSGADKGGLYGRYDALTTPPKSSRPTCISRILIGAISVVR